MTGVVVGDLEGISFWQQVVSLDKNFKGILILMTIKISFLIYDLQSEDWINTYYMLKAHRPPKVSNEMKWTNEKMTWINQDMNLSNYVPKANVDHTISGQGTGIST